MSSRGRPGANAAQPLSYYCTETDFVRVIDEPDQVRRYADAVQRGVFHYLIHDVAQGPMRTRDAEAIRSGYELLFEVTGEASNDRYTVFRRRR